MEVFIDNFQQEMVKIGLKGIDEIVQNIKLLLNTPKGSVPLDRDFGISWEAIDKPTDLAYTKIRAEIIKQIKRYEPRVDVKKLIIEDSEAYDGVLRIKLLVKVKQDENGKAV